MSDKPKCGYCWDDLSIRDDRPNHYVELRSLQKADSHVINEIIFCNFHCVRAFIENKCQPKQSLN